MKLKSLIIFVIITNLALAQDLKLKNVTDYSKWIMNYYKDPQPKSLFEAFKYGMDNQEIADAGSRDLILTFFAAIFREDSLIQIEFYNLLQKEKKQNLRYGYIYSLWYADTKESIKTLKEFQKLKTNKKDFENIDSLLKTKPIDIFNDPIKDPTHLDMCWADFFATGKEQGVLKIISGLENLNSQDYYEKIIASSARWSLRNNAYSHDKVNDIISQQISHGNPYKMELESILKEVDEKKQKN